MANVDRMGILQAQVVEAQTRLQSAQTPADRTRAQADLNSLAREITTLSKSPEYRTYDGGPGTPAPKQPAPAPAKPAAATTTPAPATAGSSDVSGQFRSILDYINGQADQLTSSTKQQVTAAQQAAESAYATDTMSANQLYAADVVKTQQRRQAGMDASDPQNIASTTLAALRENDKVYAKERADYDEITSRSLLTDPIGWVLGRLQLPAAAARVNAAADRDATLQAEFSRTVGITKDANEYIKADTAATTHALNLQAALSKFNEAKAKVAAITTDSAKAGLQAGSMMIAGTQSAIMAPIQIRMAGLQEKIIGAEVEKKEQEADQAKRAGAALGFPDGVPKSVLDGASPAMKQKFTEFTLTGVGEPKVFANIGRPLANTADGALKFKTAQLADRQIAADSVALQQDRKTGARRSADEAYTMAWKDSILRSTEGFTLMTNQKNPDGTVRPVYHGLDKHWDAEFTPLRADVLGFARAVEAATAAGQQAAVPLSNVMVDMVRLTNKYSNKTGTNDFGLMSTKYEQQALLAAVKSQVAGKFKLANGKPASDAQVAREISSFYTAALKSTTARNGAEQLGYQVPDNYVVRLPLPEYSLWSGVDYAGGYAVDLRNPASMEEYLQLYRKAETVIRRINQSGYSFDGSFAR